eukprot:516687-Prymnesium_polylepis.3
MVCEAQTCECLTHRLATSIPHPPRTDTDATSSESIDRAHFCAHLRQIMQRNDRYRGAVQRVSRRRPVVVVVDHVLRLHLAFRRHHAHPEGLQNITDDILEERKVKLQRQVDIRHVQRDALCPREPKRQWIHILARKPQPGRKWPEQPPSHAALHDTHLRWR